MRIDEAELGNMGAMRNPPAPRGRETMAASLTNPTKTRMKSSTDRKTNMIEVPPARNPEEPGAFIPHAGICEGGVGQLMFLP